MARPASRFLVSASLLALACLAGAGAHAKVRTVSDKDAPRALPADGPVEVRWGDPEQFTEIRVSHNPSESRRGTWVVDLAEYLRERATPRLAPGERLEVELIDIDRAGDFEPWRGINLHDTRVIREIYPPRITLHFRRTDANGAVLDEGERKLRDAMFMGSVAGSDNDTLRYEKRMIDQWLGRDLPAR
jgi:hypothetical protein